MTSESKKLTEPWIESKGVEYAYAYENGKLFRETGGKGLPHAVLVDPTGNVVWSGHPASLGAETIEPHLAGALKKPVFEWPDEGDARKAAKALKQGKLADAIDAAASLPEVQASLKALVTARVGGLENAVASEDWLAVSRLAERLEDQLKGLPERERVQEVLNTLKEDKQAQEILSAQERIEKLLSGKIKKKDISKLQKQLRGIISDLPDTAAARDADAALTKLLADR